MIVRIASDNDSAIAPYHDVGDPLALTRIGVFVAEGRLVVRRVIEDARYEVVSALVTPAALDALKNIVTDASPFPVYVADQSVVTRVTGFNFHRGSLALVRRPIEETDAERFRSARRLLALERVGNPDNVGGLFRVAGALGADGVLLDAGSGDPLYRKAIRTSMAATLRVPYIRIASWTAARAALGSGFSFVALTPSLDAVPLASFTGRDRPVVLMLGSEGDGLSAEALAFADVRLRIPVDPRFDSLNVVVAAGIALSMTR